MGKEMMRQSGVMSQQGRPQPWPFMYLGPAQGRKALLCLPEVSTGPSVMVDTGIQLANSRFVSGSLVQGVGEAEQGARTGREAMRETSDGAGAWGGNGRGL